jgi:uncharacterized protein YndB with AHSA1/START domain
MNEQSRSSPAGVKACTVITRNYLARVEELWELWTTKEGFESWWGPEGFRSEVHTLEPRPGGALHYDMIAVGAEHIAAMKKMGFPTSHSVRARFTEVNPHKRLTITSVIDFAPGVQPYESTIAVDFFPAGGNVRMVVTLEPMHDEELTQRAIMGFTSQLRKLTERFGA